MQIASSVTSAPATDKNLVLDTPTMRLDQIARELTMLTQR